MESVLGRYRNLIILVGVLFLQVLGLAMQVKRGNSQAQDTRLIRIWAVGAITPFERSLVWIQNGSHNLWHNYFYLRGVRAENRDLKQQIEQMRLEQVRLTEDAAQARRLQTLLSFKEQYISKTVAAQVIGSSGSDLSRVIYIDKGEKAGIRRDMAVITADGIVGKVLTVYANVAQVLLISDQSSGVGAILEKSRLQGVLRGTSTGEVVLERVMSDEQVTPGETLLTSGGDQIFPKGLPVGTVTKVGSGKDLFLNIRVRPSADLSRLEEVLVLVEKQEREPVADDNVRVRAADILAQRLPSVPEKPAADATPSAAAAALATTPAANTAAKLPPSTVKTEVNPTNGTAAKRTPGVTTKPATQASEMNSNTSAQLVKSAGANPATGSKKITTSPTGAAGSKPSIQPVSKPAIQPETKPPVVPAPSQSNSEPPADQSPQ